MGMYVAHRKFAYLLLTTLLFCANAFAADSDDIKARFSTYWSAYAAGNYLAAAQLIHPDDLAGVKSEIVPIFLDGLTADDLKLKGLAATYFDGVPEAKRKSLTGAEAMAQLMKFIALTSPEVIELIKTSRMEIGSVKLEPKDPESAVVNFNITVAGTSGADFERLAKVNGLWFIRSKEPPSATAAKLKAAFKK
jgi:hypothetical protein